MPTLSPFMQSAAEDVMGFLNEIQMAYPDAVSLASGRPDDNYFGLEEFSGYFNVFVNELAREEGGRSLVLKQLGQYSRARGIANSQVARYLARDEGIRTTPENIVITVGAQEAITLALLTLCNRDTDVILVENPAYIGITTCAAIAGYQTDAVPVQENGVSLSLLEKRIRHHRRQGRTVKIVYVIPDFQNPSGVCMSRENRLGLLRLAARYNFFILEDNAYGEFRYSGARVPPIKALDTEQRVVYIRSFAKTLYPSLRLAAMVAGAQVNWNGRNAALSDVLAATKGYVTVNTPALTQAVLGGILISNNYSLRSFNKAKVKAIGRKRTIMLGSLKKYFKGAAGISWNNPPGGFFLIITLPFAVSREDVVACAMNYQVIFTPMSFFYSGKGGECQLRLAFSNVPDGQIPGAIKRLAAFLHTKTINHSKKTKS